MERLTDTQSFYYNVIKNYIDEKGYGPTIREIAEITGRKSFATIDDMLYRLKEKGYITFDNNKYRTIRLLVPGSTTYYDMLREFYYEKNGKKETINFLKYIINELEKED